MIRVVLICGYNGIPAGTVIEADVWAAHLLVKRRFAEYAEEPE